MSDEMRVPPIAHEAWTSDIREILNSFAPAFAGLGVNGDQSEKDRLSPVLSTVLHRPELARTFFPFAKYLLTGSSLSKRHNELVVLRVSWLRSAEFEWAQHSMTATASGLFTEAEIARIAGNGDAALWSEVEVLILAAVNQLVRRGDMEEATWTGLSRHFERQQLVDLVFLVGGYMLVGLYVNAFNVPLKEGMEGFARKIVLTEP